MRISEQTIRRVQEAADILEVVEGYVPLKKKGANWWGLSPFKDEKTPSFSVNTSMGIYKDFSTGKGGDAFSFVMEMEGMNFIESVRHLAKQYSIEIEEEEVTPEQEAQQTLRDSILIVLRYAKDFYKNHLLKSSEGKAVGLSYFKERGFSDETVQKFELGYSPDGWNALETDALKNGYKEEILEASGLLVKKEEGKKYDRFRSRAMFPIHDVSGKILGFGARTLKKDDKPKYLNSPESEVYHKSDVLYGMYQAKDAIRRQDNCYLVEGYTDVISLHQAGIDNVVAASGTSLTDGQIKLISRRTKNITVLFDGDTAGIKASLRGVDMILAKGMDVRIVTFPEGQDPDSYVREIGGDSFKKYLEENAKDFILFKTQLFLDETKNDPIKKAGVIRDIVESIVKIPDSIKRSVFFKESGKLLDIEEEILITEANKIYRKEVQKQQQKEQYTPEPEVEELLDKIEKGQEVGDIVEESRFSIKRKIAEGEIIRILLLHGDKTTVNNEFLAKELLYEIREIPFLVPSFATILNMFKSGVEKRKIPTFKKAISLCNKEMKEELINLVIEKGQLSKNWEVKGILVKEKDDDLTSVANLAVKKLKLCVVEERLEDVKKEMIELEQKQNIVEGFEESFNNLMKVQIHLKEQYKAFSS